MEKAVRERFDRLEGLTDKSIRAHEAAIARIDRAEARMDRHEARFEKGMPGFEKLVLIGTKQIIKLGQLQKESSEKINALIDSQQRTEARLRAFISSLEKGRNGRH